MKTNPDNYFGASSTISALKLEIMDAIWGAIGHQLANSMKDSESPFDREKYYEANRKIFDSLDKFIGTFNCEHIVSVEQIKQMGEDETKNYIYHYMSSKIADEVFKSDSVAVRILSSDYHPDRIYKVEIPFLKQVNK